MFCCLCFLRLILSLVCRGILRSFHRVPEMRVGCAYGVEIQMRRIVVLFMRAYNFQFIVNLQCEQPQANKRNFIHFCSADLTCSALFRWRISCAYSFTGDMLTSMKSQCFRPQWKCNFIQCFWVLYLRGISFNLIHDIGIKH